ncbi:uncharacterized protein LOC143460585 [Clavelina lepadiformis]|uniref:uncharacterized protein LOC143460585 n=1 Tax=Clavelina lepadiformis TaxID=159417 RepID=UPI004041CDA2
MTTRAERKSKGVYGKWDEEAMRHAIGAVRDGTMGIKKAAEQFHVPKTTLLRRLKKKNKIALGSRKMLGRSTDLPEEIENQLAKHIEDMEAKFYGLTSMDLQKLAFQIAEANNISTRFNKEKKIAGYDWVKGFLKRHPEISLRSPEATSLARASGFNKPQIAKFFELIHDIYEKNNLTAARIYNMDESGINVVQKLSKVLAKKGKHQVGSITSQERGQNVTVICCMSAAGNFVPPGFIFPRVRMKEELKDGAPPGSMFTCQKKGWMNNDIFLEWIKHFSQHAKPSQEERVLLILDGHKSHTHNIEALELASKSGVIMLSLPPHTSHRMQPLDLTFFKPLKTYYYQQIEQWLRANPGRAVSAFQICRLFGLAYGKAANVSCAVNGFRKAGIYPVNMLVFNDGDFAAADVTDQPDPAENSDDLIATTSSALVENASSTAVNTTPACINKTAETSNLVSDMQASPVGLLSSISYSEKKKSVVTVTDISPLPKRIRSMNPGTKR